MKEVIKIEALRGIVEDEAHLTPIEADEVIVREMGFMVENLEASETLALLLTAFSRILKQIAYPSDLPLTA